MAWLAVDKDGCEYIFMNKPEKFESSGQWLDIIYETTESHYDMGSGDYEDEEIAINSGIKLPEGTIDSLIHRNMKWEDTPTEF